MWIGIPLLGAVAAQSLGLGAGWGVGALWLGGGLRAAVAWGRPRVQLSWRTASGDDQAIVHDLRVLGALEALRRHHPTTGPQGIDELLAHHLRLLGATHGRPWGIVAAYVAQLLLLPLWLALGLLTLAGCLWHGDPPSQSLFVFGMGPPLSVLLWPASGVLGLLLLAPFAAFLSRRT